MLDCLQSNQISKSASERLVGEHPSEAREEAALISAQDAAKMYQRWSNLLWLVGLLAMERVSTEWEVPQEAPRGEQFSVKP